MIVTFTGTQKGMTWKQRSKVFARMSILHATELRHGDCIGGDAEAHLLAKRRRMRIVRHPPINNSKRAFCEGADETRDPKPYLVRNHDMVDESNAVIAAPKSKTEQWQGSGTWATIRYAKKTNTPLYIVYPDGTEEIVWEKPEDETA
jgi:hypothetical protein